MGAKQTHFSSNLNKLETNYLKNKKNGDIMVQLYCNIMLFQYQYYYVDYSVSRHGKTRRGKKEDVGKKRHGKTMIHDKFLQSGDTFTHTQLSL